MLLIKFRIHIILNELTSILVFLNTLAYRLKALAYHLSCNTDAWNYTSYALNDLSCGVENLATHIYDMIGFLFALHVLIEFRTIHGLQVYEMQFEFVQLLFCGGDSLFICCSK